MHYFVFGLDFAAVQDTEQAQKHADAGWERVNVGAFILAWQARDGRDVERIKGGRAGDVAAIVEGDSFPGPVAEREVSGRARWVLVEKVREG